jgi:trimethylamine:corrinoid methyltransferase-like protein
MSEIRNSKSSQYKKWTKEGSKNYLEKAKRITDAFLL